MHLPLLNIIDTIRQLGWGGAFELLRNGLVLGSLYALIALGYTMVYGILKLLNFAHGDIYMVGAFLGYGVLTWLGGPLSPDISLVPLIILMFFVAMLGAGLLGVAIERFAYRPLRNAPRIAPLISALGVAFFLENSVLLLTNGNRYNYSTYELGGDLATATPGPLFRPAFNVMGRPVTNVQVLVVATSLGLMVALTLLVARTRLGKAMRATAFDRTGDAAAPLASLLRLCYPLVDPDTRATRDVRNLRLRRRLGEIDSLGQILTPFGSHVRRRGRSGAGA